MSQDRFPESVWVWICCNLRSCNKGRQIQDIQQHRTRTATEMQSSYRPMENLPLQGVTGDGTVVVPMPEHPKDYIVWSMSTLYFGNPFCLGLLAFYFSVKSRDRKMVGDLTGAKSYGSTACCINGWALGLIIVTAIIIIIAVAVLVSAVTSYAPKYYSNYPNRY
uniref:Uncharacterized protein n=1 Tax=Pygocentrus nattereri TaxID=42514 RepID=A0A3B4DGJ0_PYGNA